MWARILLKTGEDALFLSKDILCMGLFLKKVSYWPPEPFGQQAGHERFAKRTQIADPNIVSSLVFEHSIADMIKLPERDTQTV
jgi:hypothetical protein